MGRLSQLTKVGIGFVSLWLIVYVVVYLIFLFSEGEPADLTDIDHTTGGGIRAKFMHMVLPHAYGSSHNSNSANQQHLAAGPGQLNTGSLAAQLALADTVPTLLSNPFLSSQCNEYVDLTAQENMSKGYTGDIKKDSIAIIIPVRNEAPEVVIHTIKSIYSNSGPELKTIVIVDDVSDDIIREWPHWEEDDELNALLLKKCTGGNTKQCLRIIRPVTRLGVSGAKHYGASIFTDALAAKGTRGDGAYHDSKVTTLVFVDSHVVVSKSWLLPLVHTLQANPTSIVYPQIDVIDRTSGAFVEGDNMIGSFDWSLRFKWENLGDSATRSRIPIAYHNNGNNNHGNTNHGNSNDGSNTATLSPASPGMLAITIKLYADIGGFDINLKPWGQESIELSLRVWLCGGTVIKQSCSRVANRYDHLFSDSITSPKNGVSQQSIDKNVMSIAEHWFTPAYREIIYKARFGHTKRVPYSIPVAERRMPAQFSHVKPIVEGTCQPIQWYLDNIYPGLLPEINTIETMYYNHINSEYMDHLLSPILSQYQSDRHAPEIDSTAVQARVGTPEERTVSIEHDSLIPKAIYNPHKVPHHMQSGDGNGVLAPEVAIFKSDAKGDVHEQHANKIRETLVCEDEVIVHGTTCADRKKRGECESSRYYMIFGCPKTCNLCGIDGKMCVDFFEHKCPGYEREGKCVDEKEQMMHDCRFSCGFCKRVDGTLPEKDRHKNAVVDTPKQPPLPQQQQAAEPVNDMKVSPYIAQQQYASGSPLASDKYTKQPCFLKGRPHGNLLDRLHIATPAEYLPTHTSGTSSTSGNTPIKIFCGIYTQAKNHDGNVQATKEVWAKKCDGFLAFSTATDLTIPAIQIKHEGKEEYDNMWVKSKSIWKYIAAQYLHDFDFFLMGGDDMFYIIENLRFYLNSAEIKQRLEDTSTSGLFLGRRFYPPKQQVFNSGGAGYILDRKSLQILRDNLDTPKCFPHQHGFWEDVNIANCLRVSTKPAVDGSDGGHLYKQILPYDTRDKQERERFHPFTPGQHLTYQPPKPGQKDWYKDYNPFLKLGYDCCSDRSVSFHYVPAELMKTLNSYLYKCEQRG